MSRRPLLADRADPYDPRASFGVRNSAFNLAPQNLTCTALSFRRKRPKRVSNYILGPILGEGSYGVVRDAIDTASMKRVAVKCIKKGFRTNPNAARIEQQLVNEVEHLQRFHHPNVIRANDIFCSAQGKDYMVLPVAVCSVQQLLDLREEEVTKNCNASAASLGSGGSPLAPGDPSTPIPPSSASSGGSPHLDGSFALTFGKQRLIPAALAKDIFFQILSGVEYIHQQSIAHNDIKPENVLMFADGNVKLTDLGSIGQKFIGRGTPAYLSPEATGVIEDAEVDALANDCWSCGILLYWLCTGRLPFSAPTEFALYKRIAEEPVDLSLIPEDCSDVCTLISGLLEKEHNKRMTSAEALRHPWLQSAIVTASFKRASNINTEDTEGIREGYRKEISHHNVRRVFNMKDIAEMIELDEARHKQFCHELRYILDLPAASKEAKRQMEELRPVFISEKEMSHYSRKGTPDNDVRTFRQVSLKLSGVSTYCTKVLQDFAPAVTSTNRHHRENCCSCRVS